MNAFLKYQSEGSDIEYTLTKQHVSVGRGETNDVALGDPRVSRSHALLRGTDENNYYLIDLGSKNGTYINGKRVVVPALLKDDDVIRVGTTSITFVLPRDEDEAVEGSTGYETISKTPTSVSIDMEMIQATVLVADIQGYTAMSEQLPLDFLAKLMGDWFRYSNEIIEKNNGSVDKFIGDAVMACWLSREEGLQEAIKEALAAAGDLLKMTDQLDQARSHSLPNPLRIGIGISTGEAVASDFGSGRPKDYTVMGDSVNLAFRLEKAAKELGGDVAITYDSLKNLEESSSAGCKKAIDVKGKDEPLQIWLLKHNEIADIVSLL